MARTLTRRSRYAALAGAILGSTLLTVPTAPPANAVTVTVRVAYIKDDPFGVNQYDVRFNGTVRSDGPNAYIIEGELDAYCHHGTLTGQSVRLDYGATRRSWQDVRYWCTDTPVPIRVRGSRDYGDTIDIKVGATSGSFNTYQFGETQRFNVGVD
ncbi:hypothetical protein WBK31_14785 [Nonomuraea sp. N2-4H]|jgi:hypothetical protein|uniref:hypothetical protein n=1 Tax=unclassified Nonomuraea TaxID=2593643 RepID=UPI003247CF80